MDDWKFEGVAKKVKQMTGELGKVSSEEDGKHSLDNVKKLLETMENRIVGLREDMETQTKLRDEAKEAKLNSRVCGVSMGEGLSKIEEVLERMGDDLQELEDLKFALEEAAKKYFESDPSLVDELFSNKKARIS